MKRVMYQKDKRDETWFVHDERDERLWGPDYTIPYTIEQVRDALFHGYSSNKPRHLALLKLPYCTRPAWPEKLTTPLHLLYWLCAECGSPLVAGIGRVTLLFVAGYGKKGPNLPKMGVRWQVSLVGSCCLKEHDLVKGTSYTHNVLQLYNNLETPMNEARQRIQWPCTCGQLQKNCANRQTCRETRMLMEQMKRRGDPDYSSTILKNRLELFIDLLKNADIISPIRYNRCHNLACDRALPNNHKKGGFGCETCRRVVYCTPKCRNRLKKTHEILGCEPYNSWLDSKRLEYIK